MATISGDDGINVLFGDLSGFPEADVIRAFDGEDVVFGYDGDDLIEGGAGADQLYGGGGSDTVSYLGSTSGVEVNLSISKGFYGDAEGDIVENFENVLGSSFGDHLDGDTNANTLRGAGGGDTLEGGAGADQLYGGGGIDTVSYVGSTSGVEVNLSIGKGFYGEAEGDIFKSLENVLGSNLGDLLIGDSSANTLRGAGGGDTLEGGGGADRLDGGAGVDTVSYINSGGGVIVDLPGGRGFVGDAAGDILFRFENAIGSNFGDRLIGDAKANILVGYEGNDILLSGAGGDELLGEECNDRLDGGKGEDQLLGGTGNDVLQGMGGNDTINSGTGADTVTGGLGNDRFDFLEIGSGVDQITDFSNVAGNNDTLRFDGSALLKIGAGALSEDFFAANEKGVAVDANDFFVYETGTGILSYDSNGSAAGGVTIIATLTGAPTLTASDVYIL